MFKIFYNNSNPFEGISPTPFVEREITPTFYAKAHGDVETFSLRGTVTGSFCSSGNEFSGFWRQANRLVDRFSKSFQTFRIFEDFPGGTGVLYTNGHAIIRSIDFEESVFAGLLPYTISLDVFRENTFSNYGIMEPSQEISFEDGDNGDVIIQKNTSARGFNTNLSAVENARVFVQGLTGIPTGFSPKFISSSGQSKAVLTALTEKVNRLDGSYEVNESWLYSAHGNNLDHSVSQKAVNISSGEGGFEVSVNGKLQGAIGVGFENLRTDFNSMDLLAVAEEEYEKYSLGELYYKPISKQVEENSQDNTISFTLVYSDKITEDPYIRDSISISWDAEKNKNCVRSAVEIVSVDPCPVTRWQKVLNYSNSFSINSWTTQKLMVLGYNISLPNKPNSSSSSYREQDGSISISASSCEKKIIVPIHFDDLKYTVTVSPAMPTFIPFQGINDNGNFTIQKLGGLTRREVSIQGSAVIAGCSTYDQAKASLISYINSIKSTFLNGTGAFLTKHEVSRAYGQDRKTINFTFGWNEKSSTPFSTSKLHSTIP